MKVGLCVFFNYPFQKNIPILERYYSEAFDEIVFIQPVEKTKKSNVFTVYRASFNFGGFFSDVSAELLSYDVDAWVFTGDDCLLNINVVSEMVLKNCCSGKTTFIPEVLSFASIGWYKNFHKINTLARITKGYGLYDQRVENWLEHVPSTENITRLTSSLGFSFELERPPIEYSFAQPEQDIVIKRFFERGLNDKRSLPYPFVYAVSDFFVVSSGLMEDFLHNVGQFATLNIFPEVSVPTALLAGADQLIQAKDLDLTFDWTYGRNSECDHFWPKSYVELEGFMESLDDSKLFIHPIKLSRIKDF